MSKPTRPVAVREQDVPLEGWEDPARSNVRWRTLLSGDRTASESLTMGVAELPVQAEGSSLVRHHHAQPEAYYILSGTGVAKIGDEEFPLEAGTALFIPGDAPHGVRNTGPGPLRLLYVFPADSFEEIEYHFDEA